MSASPPAPADRVAMFIAAMTHAVVRHAGWDQRMGLAMIGHIVTRLRGIKWAFIRLAGRIAAGTYRPRAFAPRPGAAGRRPTDPLPTQRNWLEPLLPEVVHFRGYLLDMLQDPQMVALIQAAPGALGRPLRSLCRMLGLKPPPLLARPATALPPKAPPQAPPAGRPPRPPAKPPARHPASPRTRPLASSPPPAPSRRKPA